MRRLLLAGAAVVAAVGLVTAPAAAHGSSGSRPLDETVITDGLVVPLSLAAGPRGTTFVTQNFAGQLTAVARDGTQTLVYASEDGAEVGGVSYRSGTVTFTLTGETQSVWQQEVNRRGEARGEPSLLADVGAYEQQHNPDAGVSYGFRGMGQECLDQMPEGFPASYTGIVESHPYATAHLGRTTFVADAAANAILSVDRRGTVRTVAVLPPRPAVVTADAAAMFGLPDCAAGETYWFEPVPTDVEVGPGGRLYVTTLPGGPEDESLGARGEVFTVDPWSGKVRRVAGGFLGATGLAVSPLGTVYVAEMFAGRITKVTWHGNRTVVETAAPGAVEWTPTALLATVNVLPADETAPPDGRLVSYRLSGLRH